MKSFTAVSAGWIVNDDCLLVNVFFPAELKPEPEVLATQEVML